MKRASDNLLDQPFKKLRKLDHQTKEQERLITQLINKLSKLFITEPENVKEQKKILRLVKDLDISHESAANSLHTLKNSMNVSKRRISERIRTRSRKH